MQSQLNVADESLPLWFTPACREEYQRIVWFLETFSKRPWCPKIVDTRASGPSYAIKRLPTLREYRATGNLPDSSREIARKVGLAILDLHTAGLTHGNLSLATVLWDAAQGQPILAAPKGLFQAPAPFSRAWDLGPELMTLWRREGMPAPLCTYRDGLGPFLGVTSDELVSLVKNDLIGELETLGGEEQYERSDIPYGDISLPGFLELKGRRDPSVRLDAFGVSFAGESVLDVGAHTGSLLFEARRRGATFCLGLEYNDRRARWINKTAAFNGLSDKVWCYNCDVTEEALPDEFRERFSILSFQAIFGRLGEKGPASLQRCLSFVKPGGAVLLETNHCKGHSPQFWADLFTEASGGVIDPPRFVRKEWERYAFVTRKVSR